jgi:hypothetical protein
MPKPTKHPTTTVPILCAHAALVDPTDLKPFPDNPNTHPPEQLRLLTRAIMERGWRHPIIVSKLSGRIVAGHARQTVALAMRLPLVPVDYQDFASETEEREFVLADNRLAELAEMDNALLKDLLQELDTGETNIELTGYAETAIAELMEQYHVPQPVSSDDNNDNPGQRMNRNDGATEVIAVGRFIGAAPKDDVRFVEEKLQAMGDSAGAAALVCSILKDRL